MAEVWFLIFSIVMEGARWMTSNGLCPDGVVGRDGGRAEVERPTVANIFEIIVLSAIVG